MPNSEQPPMHSDFSRWYAAVAVGDDAARHELRWAGVAAIVSEANSADIEALVRLAFKSRQLSATGPLQKIRQVFKTADATFEMQGNDRELQVLAGASLAALMDAGDVSGAEAAIAVATASFNGARKPNLPIDLAVLAEGAIQQSAEALRTRPDLAAHAQSEAPKFDFEKSMAKVRAEFNVEGVAQAFGLAAETTRATFTQIARRQSNVVRALEAFLRVQDEELQMLWWLIGQRSKDLDCSFEDVAAGAQALVFAKELSDRTTSLPGPASMKGLLSRAGLKDRKKLAVSEAINAADAAWLHTLVIDYDPSPVTMPIHFGIKRQLETGAGDDWIAGWAAAVGVPANLQMSSLALGNLFYRERLLLLFGDE